MVILVYIKGQTTVGHVFTARLRLPFSYYVHTTASNPVVFTITVALRTEGDAVLNIVIYKVDSIITIVKYA